MYQYIYNSLLHVFYSMCVLILVFYLVMNSVTLFHCYRIILRRKLDQKRVISVMEILIRYLNVTNAIWNNILQNLSTGMKCKHEYIFMLVDLKMITYCSDWYNEFYSIGTIVHRYYTSSQPNLQAGSRPLVSCV